MALPHRFGRDRVNLKVEFRLSRGSRLLSTSGAIVRHGRLLVRAHADLDSCMSRSLDESRLSTSHTLVLPTAIRSTASIGRRKYRSRIQMSTQTQNRPERIKPGGS